MTCTWIINCWPGQIDSSTGTIWTYMHRTLSSYQTDEITTGEQCSRETHTGLEHLIYQLVLVKKYLSPTPLLRKQIKTVRSASSRRAYHQPWPGVSWISGQVTSSTVSLSLYQRRAPLLIYRALICIAFNYHGNHCPSPEHCSVASSYGWQHQQRVDSPSQHQRQCR